MVKIITSAPGKVILHGEHAVVYGKRALAASLNLRTYLSLEEVSSGEITLDLPDIGIHKTWKGEHLQKELTLPLCDPQDPKPASEDLMDKLQRLADIDPNTIDTKSLALVAFLYVFCSVTPHEQKLPGMKIKVKSQLPPSAGLGSSAAYSASLAAACLMQGNHIQVPESSNGNTSHEWSEETDQNLINQWAFQAEKVIHGNPSGIDNAVSVFGGALKFQGGKIEPFDKVPQLRILLSNTKVPRSTKALVSGVRQKYDKYPKIIQPVLDCIEAISNKCEALLSEMSDGVTESHYSNLQDLIEMNQHQLHILGVNHASIQSICDVSAKRGLQSKLTGAGGGGCVFTLVPPDAPDSTLIALRKDLKNLGYECWETVVGGPGVTCHTDDVEFLDS